jgi:cAMP-dependent protein kinase regulator
VVLEAKIEREDMNPATIQSVPLLGEVPKRIRSQVVRWADELDAPAGTEIIRQGEYAQESYVIVEGEASVVKDGERIATLGPGEFFGEVGLLGHKTRTASVIARTPMRLLVLAPREFSSLLLAAPAVGERVRETARKRL